MSKVGNAMSVITNTTIVGSTHSGNATGGGVLGLATGLRKRYVR
jgi:hypothetical protein